MMALAVTALDTDPLHFLSVDIHHAPAQAGALDRGGVHRWRYVHSQGSQIQHDR